MRPRRAGSRAGGALLLVCALFASSAILRGVTGVGIAQAVPTDDPAHIASPQVCEAAPARLMDELRLREEKANTREAYLDERMASIALIEAALGEQIKTLENTERRLAATISQVDGASEADIVKLTDVYEAMKPKEAAQLFSAMPADFAAGFLSRMRPETAAAVMTGLPSDAAYSISVVMAGRNARAPKD